MSPSALPDDAACARQRLRRLLIRAEQVRLLSCNVNLGLGVTVVAAGILGALEWAVVRHQIIIAWCLYMFAVSLVRYILARRYRRDRLLGAETSTRGGAFALGAGFAGTGWAAAGI